MSDIIFTLDRYLACPGTEGRVHRYVAYPLGGVCGAVIERRHPTTGPTTDICVTSSISPNQVQHGTQESVITLTYTLNNCEPKAAFAKCSFGAK